MQSPRNKRTRRCHQAPVEHLPRGTYSVAFRGQEESVHPSFTPGHCGRLNTVAPPSTLQLHVTVFNSLMQK